MSAKNLIKTKTDDYLLQTNATKQTKLSSMHMSMLQEIQDALIDPPSFGKITVSFTFHNSKLSRWISIREVARQAG